MGISLNPSTLLNGQGIDVSSLVQQVLSEKSGQLTQWQSEQATLQSQAGLLTSMNSDLNNLATAMQALSDPLGALTAQAATSSDTSVLTGTAQSTAAAETHQIVVTNLASAGTIYTNAVAGGATTSILPDGVTSGDLQIQIGGTGGTLADIPITTGSSGNNTLTTVASSINQLSTKNNWGITANVVTDGTGARLSITSQATGAPGALSISNNTTSLAFNPPSGGANASLSVDGIPYSYATNTISGPIPGVALNLANPSSGTPVQLVVGPDVQQATQAINSFVAAYNQVVNDINTQFTVDKSRNSEGPLASDSAIRTLQSSLMNDVTYSITQNGQPLNLASFGINMNDDGTLTVGTNAQGQTLAQALQANPSGFQAFFQSASAKGFAINFNADLTNLTNPAQGLLTVDLAQNQSQQQTLTDSINNFETMLTAEQTQLTTQFNQVNASLQAYPLLLQQVTETLGTIDGGSSSASASSQPTLTSGL